MKTRFLFVAFLLHYQLAWSQNCSERYTYEEVDEAVEWNLPSFEQSRFLRDRILPIFNLEESQEPPTSLHIWLDIDDKGRAIRISKCKENLTELQKVQLLTLFQNEVKFQPATINGQAVCSEYVYVVGCILYH